MKRLMKGISVILILTMLFTTVAIATEGDSELEISTTEAQDLKQGEQEEQDEQEDESMPLGIQPVAEPMVESEPVLKMEAHIQDLGWRNAVGDMMGTSGQRRRMEAIRMQIVDDAGDPYPGLEIEYRAHVKNIGWQQPVKNGAIAGTTGRALQVEAIQIELLGAKASEYTIYFKAHCADVGWLGYAQGGNSVGTSAMSKRMEALEVVLLKNPDTKDTSNRSFIKGYTNANLAYTAHVENRGDIGPVVGGSIIGTVGQRLRIEGLTLDINRGSGNEYLSGDIEYRTHVENIGWMPIVKNGAFSGTKNQHKRVEAIQIQLTGELSKYYDVYYRAHVENYGWLGWAKDTQIAGTTNCAYRMEALQIYIVAKGNAAPGPNTGSHRDRPVNKVIGRFSTRSSNTAAGFFNMRKAILSLNGRVVQPGQVFSFGAAAGAPYGRAQGYQMAGVVGGVGYGGGVCQASTTLYGAAIRSGMTIVERRSHSLPSVYVPKGLDAMVVGTSSDFKMRNDHKFPVKIVTYTSGNQIFVEIQGPDPIWFDHVVAESWSTGRKTASARRIFYKNGREVKRENLSNSYYANY